MKKVYFIILLSLGYTISAQNEYKKSVDSLYMLINKAQEVETKIEYYQNICEIYKEFDINEVSSINNVLLDFSKGSKSSKGFAYYYLNNAYLNIKNNQLASAILYAKKAKLLFYDIKDWDNYFVTCTILADYLLINDNYSETKELLETNLHFALKIKSKKVSYLYYQISRMFMFNSDYDKALIYARKAMSFEKDVAQKIKIYNVVSLIYNSLGNYSEAIKYNQLSLSITKSPFVINKLLITKMKILFAVNNYNEALSIALFNREYLSKNKNQLSKIDNTIFISECYFYLGKYTLAHTFINEVLKEEIPRTDVRMKAFALKSLICLELNKKEEAKMYIDRALLLLNETYYYEIKLFLYETKFKVEEKLGNYSIALEFHKKIVAIKDNIYTINNKNKINQLQIDFDILEKENKIKSLQLKELNNSMEIENQKDYLIYISIALLIALLSVLFYVKNDKIIRKKNNIIENERLLTQKSLLEKEILLKEIHHRVKNNLQLVMSLLYLQSKQKDISIKEFVATSQSRILSMSLVHENLYGKSDLSKVDFKEYLNNLIQHILESQKNIEKEIQLQIEVDAIYVEIQTAIPVGLIINELISNAYKHAFKTMEKGSIILSLKEKNTDVILEISDNGIGYATTEKKNNSLGLELVKQLVSQIQGNLHMQNNSGMQYVIHFKNGIV